MKNKTPTELVAALLDHGLDGIFGDHVDRLVAAAALA